jgi:hypothetical protein
MSEDGRPGEGYAGEDLQAQLKALEESARKAGEAIRGAVAGMLVEAEALGKLVREREVSTFDRRRGRG